MPSDSVIQVLLALFYHVLNLLLGHYWEEFPRSPQDRTTNCITWLRLNTRSSR